MQNYCGNCGEKLTEGCRFCPKCGTNLNAPRYQFHMTVPRIRVPKREYLPISCVLAYVPFLFWLPLIGPDRKPAHKESANQGLWITLLLVLAGVIYGTAMWYLLENGFSHWEKIIGAFDGWTLYNWKEKLPYALGCAAAAQFMLVPMVYSMVGFFSSVVRAKPWHVPLVGKIRLIGD